MEAPPGSEGANHATRVNEYQRVYKACELCRRKKIRCILIGPGDPPGPPCARCKREMRECIFSRERSTRKRDARERQRAGPREGERPDLPRDHNLVESINFSNNQQQSVHSTSAPGDGDLADTVARTLVSSGNDALQLLFRAAEQRDAESPILSGPRSHVPYHSPEESIWRPRTQPSAEVLRVWNAFRFTKMGWFTAEEAVVYVDL